MQGFHVSVAELLTPCFDRVGGGLLGRSSACPAAVGEFQQPGPGIGGIGFPRDVSALHELLDELAGRLLGYAEIAGDVHHGGVARADPHESEAVRRPHIWKAALCQPALDSVNNVCCGAKNEHRDGYTTVISHDPSLTDRSS